MGEAAVRTRGLCKRYGARAALAPLDLEVDRGEFVALLGPNGAGKSTLLSLLTSLVRPSEGEAWIFGAPLRRDSDAHDWRRALGYVGHALLAYRPLTCRQNLEFFGGLYGLSRLPQRVEEVASRFGLHDRLDDLVGSLSRGLQQRLSLSRALLHDPALLLLDEPFTGLDAASTVLLQEALKEARSSGRTVLLATHDLERAATLATRLVILRNGRKVYDGLPQRGPDAWRETYSKVLGGA
jgi:heme exporter protein A